MTERLNCCKTAHTDPRIIQNVLYTAIDECTCICYREMYDEHSIYSSKDFPERLFEAFPFPIREVQTDNGTEWTTVLLVRERQSKTLFEKVLEENDIIYHRIRVATPRHNGKVERQHRIDGNMFCHKMGMYSLEDSRAQLRRYNRRSNNILKICLSFRTPNEMLNDYPAVM